MKTSTEMRLVNLYDSTSRVDYRGKTPTKTDFGIQLITAKNIKNGWIDYDCSLEYISKEDFDSVMSRGKVQLGDVLFTTEAPLGNAAIVDDENIALAQRVIKFNGGSIIDNQYLLQYFLSSKYLAVLIL